MSKHGWLSYGDLAWTESIIAPPEHYTELADIYVKFIRDHAGTGARSLLHLGCGAGGLDHTFKRHFAVTGVDLSPAMLEIARQVNPEITYLQGDMRSIDLAQRFDVVAIPDSIDYMVTLADLRSAITTSARHLEPGGVLLVVGKLREEFRDNNFCYTGAKGGVEITIFENNHVSRHDPSTYQATLVYLVRQHDELSIHTDCHTLGLFSRAEWLEVFGSAGLEVQLTRLDGVYEPFILNEGEYPMQVLVGVKPA
jgi:SAM-dependent methyltransferase